MARGWESKSVESQIESAAEDRRNAAHAKSVSLAEGERAKKLDSLQMSRKRVLRDIEMSSNPRHREILQAGLKHLDDKLAELK